ncbi:MAG: response regulator [Lentisphaeria bacterium]
MANEKILIVEDELSIRELLKMTLESAGYHSILEAEDGEKAITMVARYLPDLILLDLMLPGMDGLTVCRKLKTGEETKRIPIIMLTAKSEESDIVLGLEMGACDYITKPFSTKVLVARIRAQFRNLVEESDSTELRYAGLVMNDVYHSVKRNGENIDLTFSEFAILHLLVAHPGHVYTRNQIIFKIKGEEYPVTERAIDVQIVNLRRKLGSWGCNIETIRGIGYRLRWDEG